MPTNTLRWIYHLWLSCKIYAAPFSTFHERCRLFLFTKPWLFKLSHDDKGIGHLISLCYESLNMFLIMAVLYLAHGLCRKLIMMILLNMANLPHVGLWSSYRSLIPFIQVFVETWGKHFTTLWLIITASTQSAFGWFCRQHWIRCAVTWRGWIQL